LLIRLDSVYLAYGRQPLLDRVDLQINAHERVCLVGRNGAGKSTLMQIIAGQAQPDAGSVWRADGLKIADLPQNVPRDDVRTVYLAVAAGLGELGALLHRYHRASAALAHDASRRNMLELEGIQHEVESKHAWRLQQKVEAVLSRLGLPGDEIVSNLSGGQQRQVLLAQALVTEPDLLLLDEPTNHLDIEAIAWLENWLSEYTGSVLFITHDRVFLQNVATRIVELDRGRLYSWNCDYRTYLQRKEEDLAAEEAADARFDKRLAREEVWIRQGVKARRTRNEGRVRHLEQMRKERARRRNPAGKAHMQIDAGEASGRLAVETERVTVSRHDKVLIKDLTVRIMRGDRIGIIGPNGAGKSTLIKTLLGELPPDSGVVRRGTNIKLAYFDQHRAHLDPERTVIDNVTDGMDSVTVNGRTKHIIAYLQDFLFTPERSRTLVKALSGGERNRLLLARLFAQPANLLVLDEPTNDLDVETLELLEEVVADYDGTLLVVSHDRAFLDNVVTGTLVFEGGGHVGEYVGGHRDWIAQRTSAVKERSQPEKPSAAASDPGAVKPIRGKKLSYKEQQELDGLPARIESLEDEQSQLQQAMAGADFYRGDKAAIMLTMARAEQLQREIEQVYARWQALDSAAAAARQ
jgi:ATP-binding cassette subfamily F protein uup